MHRFSPRYRQPVPVPAFVSEQGADPPAHRFGDIPVLYTDPSGYRVHIQDPGFHGDQRGIHGQFGRNGINTRLADIVVQIIYGIFKAHNLPVFQIRFHINYQPGCNHILQYTVFRRTYYQISPDCLPQNGSRTGYPLRRKH